MRRHRDDPDRLIACPHCGEAIRRSAPACNRCGSDRATGWRNDDDDRAAAEVEFPEPMSDADYDELIASDPELTARTHPACRTGPNDAVLRRRRRALFAIVLALLLAFGGGLYALL